MGDLDRIVLSYEDVLLRESDVDLLRGPNWLNDNIISFYFEFLKDRFKSSPEFLFVPPEVTQCIKIVPQSQIEVFTDPLDVINKKFVFFPLNDNESVTSAGGSHWSLLILSLCNHKAYHYDSAHRHNEIQAESLAMKLFKYFQLKGTFLNERALEQGNCYDCGIYVLCTAENLAQYLSSDKAIHEFDPKNEQIHAEIPLMRCKIIEIITKLKQTQ